MAFISKPAPKALVLGAGGTAASLFCTGAIGALELLARPGEFSSVYLCSGSAPPGFLWMGGMRPRRLIDKMIEYDYERLMPITTKKFTVLKAVLNSEISGAPLKIGLRDTTNLGARIQKHCPQWPHAVKTVATCGDSDIVFDYNRVYEYSPGEDRHIISNEPAPVGLAVRATASVPIHMTPVEYKGRILQDGALNQHGRCPTSLAMLHEGIKPEEIIALVPAKGDGRAERFLMDIGRHLAGNHQKELAQHAALMVKPFAPNTRTLDFGITKPRKGPLILAGFHAMLLGLNSADVLTSADADKISAKTTTIEELRDWLDQREGSDSLCA